MGHRRGGRAQWSASYLGPHNVPTPCTYRNGPKLLWESGASQVSVPAKAGHPTATKYDDSVRDRQGGARG